MTYQVYLEGYFSHRIDLSAESQQSAEILALDHLDTIISVDDYEVTEIFVDEPAPNYVSLRSFYIQDQEPVCQEQPYVSLNSFYAESEPYIPLYSL